MNGKSGRVNRVLKALGGLANFHDYMPVSSCLLLAPGHLESVPSYSESDRPHGNGWGWTNELFKKGN